MLSFIIPTYRPKLDIFDRHVKSLKDQGFKDWEAIFVLDGECPGAENIIKKHLKGLDYTIVPIEHSGAQKARNAGGEIAKGDFLCFFDSDCIIEPGTSNLWMELFTKSPEVMFIYSGYKFFGEKYAIESEPYDPFTLRVRNYISSCFPMRREVYPGWNENLKSLQDWDMWLGVLEKATELGKDINKIGIYLRGYGFSTALPDENSISGKGCTPDVWMERVTAVKKAHNLEERETCVTSIDYKTDGISLAKSINADYLDMVNDKPNNYKTIIQIGFSLGPNVEKCASAFQKKETKKILFWTSDNINEMYHNVRFKTIFDMKTLLNEVAIQYCEDYNAKKLLGDCGFKVEVLPLPLRPNPMPLPEMKKWLVDIAGDYSPMISVIEKSLPDIPLEMIGPAVKLADYTGLLHFFPDKTTSSPIKRAILTGRHVISNVEAPFCGFVSDKKEVEEFIVNVVKKVRELSRIEVDKEAITYHSSSHATLMEAVR